MEIKIIVQMVWAMRPVIVIFGSIILLLPIIYALDDEIIPLPARKCLYILIVMSISWVTEAVPIAVTALFPLVMFPMAGVLKASDTAQAYIGNTSMLFLGGLIVAAAVEESNLHKRIAISVLRVVGSDPKWIMAGLMLPTWFISMWISNTATASMMIPIATAVLQQMKPGSKEIIYLHTLGPENENSTRKRDDGDRESNKYEVSNEDNQENPKEEVVEVLDSSYARKCKCLTLCIAYAANIGGISTLTGTPPNLVLKGAADLIYDKYRYENETDIGSPISFANWMAMAVPLSFITLILGWALLVVFFLSGKGCCSHDKVQAVAIKRVIREEWDKLGKVTFAECMMLVLFSVLVILWLSRDTKESPGWSDWFDKGYTSDATSAMLIVLLLFILPAKVPNVFCLWNPDKAGDPFYTPLLTWSQCHQKVPWGVLLLLGGGFALAKGVIASHLDSWLAEKLQTLSWIDTSILNLVLCLIVAAFTEVTSNTATSQILMPILSNLSISLKVNPLYFMSSACIASSFAFMLPAATAPNAIVFSYGNLRVIDMLRVGFFMNLIAVGCLTMAVNTWGSLIFKFDTLDPLFERQIAFRA